MYYGCTELTVLSLYVPVQNFLNESERVEGEGVERLSQWVFKLSVHSLWI